MRVYEAGREGARGNPCPFGAGRLARVDLLDSNRGGLELGGSRFRVGRVDGEDVRVDLVREVERHEREPRAQRGLDPDGGLDRAAPRRDLDHLALLDEQPLSILGRELERLTAVKRRAVQVRLHTGVVRLEPPARRQPDRIVSIESLEGRAVLDDRERRRRPLARLLPEPAVQERRPGMAHPLDRATGCRSAPRGGCSSCRRASG